MSARNSSTNKPNETKRQEMNGIVKIRHFFGCFFFLLQSNKIYLKRERELLIKKRAEQTDIRIIDKPNSMKQYNRIAIGFVFGSWF